KQRGLLKTKSSKRAINLTDKEMDVLKYHKHSQLINTEKVCATSVGTYFIYSNIRRAMKFICKDANVKVIRFHDLRHTHATLLVEAGAPAKAVPDRLGHADVRITLERYTHLSSKTHQETAKRFAGLLTEDTETV
ncbi:MAG: site-specific integrase, partial [Alkalibacterium sp.]|nr:site-specific integrase [Alkalibacterium sp.]